MVMIEVSMMKIMAMETISLREGSIRMHFGKEEQPARKVNGSIDFFAAVARLEGIEN